MKKVVLTIIFVLTGLLLNGCVEQQPNNLETFWNADIDFVLSCPDVSDDLTEKDLQTLYSYYQSDQAKEYVKTMEDAIQKEKESGKWDEIQTNTNLNNSFTPEEVQSGAGLLQEAQQLRNNPLKKMQDEYDTQLQRIQACEILMNGVELSKIEDITEVITIKMRALEIPEMKKFVKEMGRQNIIDYNTKQ